MTRAPIGLAFLIPAFALGGVWARAGEAPAAPVFDVPRVENVAVDGKADDWGEQGFRVEVLADPTGKAMPTANYDASFRLGWDDNGLLVLITVQDDVFLEPFKKPEELWKGDSVELFMATKRGGEDSFQVVIAPGCDPNNAEARHNISDYRKNTELAKTKLEITVARTKVEHGFVMEVLLPWKNLGIEAKEGREVGFQFYANDSDKEGERFQLLWYPVPEANVDSSRMYSLRLAAKPSPAVRAVARGGYDAEGLAQINVVAVGALKGRQVKVKDDDKTVGKAKLEAEGGRAAAKITLPTPKEKAYGPLSVSVDDEAVGTVTLPEKTAK
jgi:hypothetical protein